MQLQQPQLNSSTRLQHSQHTKQNKPQSMHTIQQPTNQPKHHPQHLHHHNFMPQQPTHNNRTATTSATWSARSRRWACAWRSAGRRARWDMRPITPNSRVRRWSMPISISSIRLRPDVRHRGIDDARPCRGARGAADAARDRKSTRLNSSH